MKFEREDLIIRSNVSFSLFLASRHVYHTQTRHVCPRQISIPLHRYNPSMKLYTDVKTREDIIPRGSPPRYHVHVDEWRVQWALINHVPRQHVVHGIINIHALLALRFNLVENRTKSRTLRTKETERFW